jgi:ATPase family associated with various cellular activities (AAA)
MSDVSKWQENNSRYLSAALAWLRLLLRRQAQRETASAGAPASPPAAVEPAPAPPAEASRLSRLFSQRSSPQPAEVAQPEVKLLLPAVETISDEDVAGAAEAMKEAEGADPPPAMKLLAQRFGLSRFEQETLLLCAAIELDTSLSSLCNLAQSSLNRPFPTFALALTIFENPAWEALSPERPLRYWRLIEINQPGAQPLTTSALRADERVVNYLKGLNYLDERLAPLLVPITQSGIGAGVTIPLPPSQQKAVETITRQIELAAKTERLPIIQLLGGDASSKQLIAWRAAAALGLHLYRLPSEWLPGHAAELETLARFLSRESILSSVAFYLDAFEIREQSAEPAVTAQPSSLNRFLARCDGLFFLDTRDVRQGIGRATVALDINKPEAAEQREVWEKLLGQYADGAPALLAGQFNLGLAEMEQIARAALGESTSSSSEADASLIDRLWDACLAMTRPRMDALAQRIEPKADWDDLVLPEAEMKLLRQIAAQVGQRAKVYEEWGFSRKMNRGLGISALFAGESGTGKTMAAEVIAIALRLNLYRIDLSAVVSKYIGETEKNLRRLFDAAEDGGAILFFDEADALFGKRSEVKDSHDRYANIEINYLLQRMEAYRGLAILATNMKSALDQAFTRRLRFIVNFPFPGAVERRLIWQKVFPPQTETRGLDFDRLSRLNLTGGSIHNVALNAAFMAARANKPVMMPFIFEAARAEFAKQERPVSEADFRWQEPEETKETVNEMENRAAA